MNLLIISDDSDFNEKLAMDVWKGNTNYTIVNLSPFIWGKEFKAFAKDKKLIVCSTTRQFKEREINEVLSKLLELNFTPILTALNEDDFTEKMYTMLKDELEDTTIYYKNDKNEGYDELVKICQEFILRKGTKNDKVIQTSTGGEGETTEE